MDIENVAAFVLAKVAVNRDAGRVILWEIDEDDKWAGYVAQMLSQFRSSPGVLRIFERQYVHGQVEVDGVMYSALTRLQPKRDLAGWKEWWLKGLKEQGIKLLDPQQVAADVEAKKRSADYM